MLSGNLDLKSPKLSVYMINLGEKTKERTVFLLDELRKVGISSDTDYENKSLKAQMRKANGLKVRFVCIIGEDELTKNVVTVKDMTSGQQEEIAMGNFINLIKAKL